MTEKPKCSKCGGEMMGGFILDADHSGGLPGVTAPIFFTQGRWVAGEPERSGASGIKWDDKEAYRIRAWRCPDCGFVELYATEPSKYRETP